MTRYDEIIKEMKNLQDKATDNSDYWTIQMCIGIVKKYKEKDDEPKGIKFGRNREDKASN